MGGTALRVLHTPGHAPARCCFHAPELGVVFTGDTLFPAVRARPAARTATSTPSSSRSATRLFDAARPRRSCTPATATTPRSARRRRRSAGPSGPGSRVRVRRELLRRSRASRKSPCCAPRPPELLGTPGRRHHGLRGRPAATKTRLGPTPRRGRSGAALVSRPRELRGVAVRPCRRRRRRRPGTVRPCRGPTRWSS